MKAIILFHSVTGCCYELAEIIKSEFDTKELLTDIYRVPSFSQEKFAKEYETASTYYNKILSIPEIDIDIVLDYDIMVICSPTYFGNVSAEIKYFMDRTEKYWLNRDLKHMTMLSVTSSATPIGGGCLTLQCINTFAQHMGMKICQVYENGLPAYGLLHIAGETSQNRPTDNDAIRQALSRIAIRLLEEKGQ